MSITFDLFSLMPYLFTVFLFLGGVCISALMMLAVLFAVSRRNRSSETVTQASRSTFAVSGFKMPDFPSEDYNAALQAVERSPAELFPPNKVVVRCGGCGEHIRGGEGYSHYNIGTRKFFCRSCHVAKGLPLREE